MSKFFTMLIICLLSEMDFVCSLRPVNILIRSIALCGFTCIAEAICIRRDTIVLPEKGAFFLTTF